MFLDNTLQTQFKSYVELLENNIVITYDVGEDDKSKDLESFLTEIQSFSNKIQLEKGNLNRTPSFSLGSVDSKSRIEFAAIPLGHEFATFVLALLQVGGRTPKLDETIINRIKKINTPLNFVTYISLSCHICPDVVQALNAMAVLNENITSTMVDGGIFEQEVNDLGIMAVPTVYLNGEMFESGRLSVEDILNMIMGEDEADYDNLNDMYDVVIIGGGPAGASSAVYSARKGLSTLVISDRIGGQVLETKSIENLIGTPYTEGSKLALSLEEHMKQYEVDTLKRFVVDIKYGDIHDITLNDDHHIKAKTIIITTGARWRNVNVPGEQEFKNKGVAYCPHCDGPLFKGKDVAVIGGGNSGMEAALDLSNIANHVTVIEFLDELKADKILQDKAKEIDNITIYTNSMTTEINGTTEVEGITFENRETKESTTIPLNGVFVQIGLMPNTEWLNNSLPLNNRKEIIVNEKGETSIPGVFAAGDCTDSPYKQIIISMGSGATAALSAFDYLMRK